MAGFCSRPLRFALTSRTAVVDMTTGRDPSTKIEPTHANGRQDNLVYAPNAKCNSLWLSWPAMQERAIAAGTVLVFNVSTSVGNLFLIFGIMIKVTTKYGV